MSHQVLVTKIHEVRPIPKYDRIALATVGAYQVIVDANTLPGDLVLFFDSELQLSEEYAKENDLIKRKVAEGVYEGGMFEINRRVRILKLAGCRSEGFVAKLSTLDYTGFDTSKLKEGDLFDEVNGHSICNKYVTPATARMRGSGKQGAPRKNNIMFPKHIETEQLRKFATMIPPGSVIYISSKSHGTSFRRAHVLERTPIKRSKFKEFFAKLFNRPTHVEEWVHLDGTRNTILQTRKSEQAFYGKELFRHRAVEGIELHKGEVLYGELVGYTETNQPIMAVHDTTKLKDKDAIKKFGTNMLYKYGMVEGNCDLYVYRISRTNEDGKSVDLSWPQVKGRCRELGLKHVVELDHFIYDGDINALLCKVEVMVNGEDGKGIVPDPIDPSHIQEGVVVRYEHHSGFGWLKEKSYAFKLMEGILKEKDTFVDMEEVS